MIPAHFSETLARQGLDHTIQIGRGCELVMISIEHEGFLFRSEKKIHRITGGSHEVAFSLIKACNLHGRAGPRDLR